MKPLFNQRGGWLIGGDWLITLPKTNIAPEIGPGAKRKQSYSNHPSFRGYAKLRGGYIYLQIGWNIFMVLGKSALITARALFHISAKSISVPLTREVAFLDNSDQGLPRENTQFRPVCDGPLGEAIQY